MSTSWKSTKRHYCKICNIWCAADPFSIRRHEQGNRHKENVENHFKKKREDKIAKERAERDLAKQWREINKAAAGKFFRPRWRALDKERRSG